MNIRICLILMLMVILSPVTLRSGTHHYCITNNDLDGPNTATIGELVNGKLSDLKTLQTGGSGNAGGGDYFPTTIGVTRSALIQNGGIFCIYLADTGSSDIAAFSLAELPQITKVGNYSEATLAGGYGIALAAGGSTLFAQYDGSYRLAAWTINPDCSLALERIIVENDVGPPDAIAVTPDGKTVVASYGGEAVASFSFGSNGVFTEHGPYQPKGYPTGVDITSDGAWALFADSGDGDTEIEAFAINSDGSLGNDNYFTNLGPPNSSCLRLSPNGKFIYVTNYDPYGIADNVTSLAFSENPLGVSLIGTTALRMPTDEGVITLGQLATISATGDGGGLYVAEDLYEYSAIALLQINADGTTTELADSPFKIIQGGGRGLISLSAWPLRPF